MPLWQNGDTDQSCLCHLTILLFLIHRSWYYFHHSNKEWRIVASLICYTPHLLFFSPFPHSLNKRFIHCVLCCNLASDPLLSALYGVCRLSIAVFCLPSLPFSLSHLCTPNPFGFSLWSQGLTFALCSSVLPLIHTPYCIDGLQVWR